VLALVGLWLFAQFANAVNAIFGGYVSGTTAFAVLTITTVLVWFAQWWLRMERPWSWWRIFGAPVAIIRMLITWRATCEGLGLSIPAKRFSSYGVVGGGRRGGGVLVKGEPMKLVAPRRARLHVSGCALVLTVALHPGQTPSDWDKAAEAFAHQWRVHRVRTRSGRPGFVTLTGLGFDPLRYPPPAKPLPYLGGTGPALPGGAGAPPSSPGHVLVDYAVIPGVLKVPVGIQEDGDDWFVDLTKRAHYLVTGATRSGKSTLTVRFLSELARRPVAIVGIDAKNGMELSPFLPRLSALAMTRAEAAAAIDALVAVMWLRTQLCRENQARTIWELPVQLRPQPLVVVVDEIAELFLAVDKEGKEEAHRCVTGLIRVSQLGAALGVHLWVAGQRFGSDLGSGATLLRAQLSGRICHRVTDHETAVMTLAGLPVEAIEEAQQIDTDLAGVAVIGDDSGEWMLGRSSPLSMNDASAIAARYAGLTVPLVEVTAAIEGVRLREGDWT
jgi:S-DNA-T family DNA segregation ATPase FtsK/SpoIIIE